MRSDIKAPQGLAPVSMLPNEFQDLCRLLNDKPSVQTPGRLERLETLVALSPEQITNSGASSIAKLLSDQRMTDYGARLIALVGKMAGHRANLKRWSAITGPLEAVSNGNGVGTRSEPLKRAAAELLASWGVVRPNAEPAGKIEGLKT